MSTGFPGEQRESMERMVRDTPNLDGSIKQEAEMRGWGRIFRHLLPLMQKTCGFYNALISHPQQDMVESNCDGKWLTRFQVKTLMEHRCDSVQKEERVGNEAGSHK